MALIKLHLAEKTKVFSVAAAIVVAQALFGGGAYDASVADFPRLAGETGDSARIMRAVDAAGRGGIVWFPRGEYEIDAMLAVTNQSSLLMHKSAHLMAVREMPFVLTYSGGVSNSSNAIDRNLFIKGGDIDGNGFAGCAQVMGVVHFTMADSTFRNGKGVGLQFGDSDPRRKNAGGYEIVANNLYFICDKPGLAGNVGLLTYIGDSHFTDIVVVDYTTGIRDMRWSNRFTRCHVWGGRVKKPGTEIREMLENSVAFDLQGSDAVLENCYAETAMTGFRVCRDARIFNCAYYNNWHFKMDNPTVFRHEGGNLIVTGCRFSKTSPKATLYSSGKSAGSLAWRDNNLLNFADAEKKGLSGKLKH